MAFDDLDARVAAVRAFSRFYTRRIGVLHEGLLGSALSLAEGRVVWELAQIDGTTASALSTALDLDPGYLSRMLRGLEANGLIERRPSPGDGRQAIISLSESGRRAYDDINGRSHTEIATMLLRLTPTEQARLVTALGQAQSLLGGAVQAPPITIRMHRPGDIGWVIHRQAAIYAAEFGWDGSFEGLLAEIGAAFIREFDPSGEACWIAERDGAIQGSVSLVRVDRDMAKLRMLYVEQAARGEGVGRLLVETCICFARDAGYRKVTLWTNDVLTQARRLYDAVGFHLVIEEPPRSTFGIVMASETWELILRG
jgi:DNA-binding MarR family transcriptional regulator/GNAT superfamily N-acetyltransferase